METISTLATAIQKQLETAERTDGSEYIRLKMNCPQWMHNAIREVHNKHGKNIYDDAYFMAIDRAIDTFAELDEDVTEDEIRDSIFEIEPDIYTSDLKNWFSVCDEAESYIQQAADQRKGTKNNGEFLMAAQAEFFHDVADTMLFVLKKHIED